MTPEPQAVPTVHVVHIHIDDSTALQDPPTIPRIDLENLIHFAQIWTDITDVTDDGDKGGRDTTSYHLGFFTVHVNPQVPLLEFFGLLSKIPWECVQSPGLHQISYAAMAQLFEAYTDNPYKVAIQTMVLGDYFKLWYMINPYTRLSTTPPETRLLLSGMGNLAVYLEPHYLQDCRQLIETVDLNNETIDP